MNTNDCIKQVHAALVAKAKEQCAVEGNNKLALEISGKIAEYGAAWAAAFGNDGKLDDDEERMLTAKFNALVDSYLPKKDGVFVEKAWNGARIGFKHFGIELFKGVKNYLNEWFKLGLACLAVAVLCGCKSFYENAGAHVRTGSITAPIEVSEPTSSINVRALYAMDGIDFYAAKNCNVKMWYTNDYTNTYFGIIETHGRQSSRVEIEPTEGP